MPRPNRRHAIAAGAIAAATTLFFGGEARACRKEGQPCSSASQCCGSMLCRSDGSHRVCTQDTGPTPTPTEAAPTATPDPNATPTATPEPSAWVLEWDGSDYTFGNSGAWADRLLDHGGTFAVQTAVVPPGEAVAGRFDLPAGSESRAELTTGNNGRGRMFPEQEYLIDWWSLFPDGQAFATSCGGMHNETTQHKTDKGCYSGGLSVYGPDGHYYLRVRGGALIQGDPACEWEFGGRGGGLQPGDYDAGPVTPGWDHWQLNVFWSADPAAGFVNLWRNDVEVVPFTATGTMPAGATWIHFRQGLYRCGLDAPATLWGAGARIFRPA